jgi:hypothetical protein
MLDSTRLSRIIMLALASCAVTWALAAGAMARPADAPNAAVQPNAEVAPPPVYKVVPGDTNKAPSASTAPAFKAIVADSNKAPDRAAVDRNLASLNHGGKAGPVRVVSAGNDNTGTIALITAIAAMLVALAAVTFIAVRPRGPALGA